MESEVQMIIHENNLSNIGFIGRLPNEELTRLIKGARFLVWPSEGYYETFGYVAVESFACGVPVIASRIGTQEEIIRDGITGVHFEPGNPDDLAGKVKWAWDHPSKLATMGRDGRREYIEKYTGERNFPLLMDAYERAIGKSFRCGS